MDEFAALGSRNMAESSEGYDRSPTFPTNLAQYREDYEREKDNRLQRTYELRKQREEILQQRERLLALRQQSATDGRETRTLSESGSSLSRALERAERKVPDFSRNVQALKKEEERRQRYLEKPYRGELGAGSYEPWQLDDFYFVREFLTSWVDEVLDFIVLEPANEFQERMKKVTAKFQKDLQEEEAYQELNQEIVTIEGAVIDEVTAELAVGIAEESFDLHEKVKSITDNLILGTLKSPNVGNENNKTSLVNNAFLQIKKERQKRKGVWQHTQSFQFHGSTGDTELESQVEEDVFTGTVLSFHDITPYDDIPDRQMPQEFLDYRAQESQIWAGVSPLITTVPLSKRYKGFFCSALTSDHSLIALGSVQGDIAVWDMMLYPPRIIRSSRGRSTIIKLQWSFDSSRLLSLNGHGIIQLWSLKDSISVPYDVKAFEPVEENLGFKPSALVNVWTLGPKDLFFTAGPFTESTDLIGRAATVAFHPSMTLLGKQDSIMVGLVNGNILRLTTENDRTVVSFPKVAPNNAVPHKVGKGFGAELFKSHHNPIISISFLCNSSTMVSVDGKGFINLWEYSEESLTGFGWFIPVQQYRLELSEITYQPAQGVEEKVQFTDVVKGQGR